LQAKEYINKLEELAFKFRDDNDLCDVTCSKCELNKGIINNNEQSYCYILRLIYNASKDDNC
jgi:hypothetical protein